MSVTQLDLLSAVTGESIAVFKAEELENVSVKVLKERLAQHIGLPRFRVQIVKDNRTLDDDLTMTTATGDVQLVKTHVLPPDPDREWIIMFACAINCDELLAGYLNQLGNPNFVDAEGTTPLFEAAS